MTFEVRIFTFSSFESAFRLGLFWGFKFGFFFYRCGHVFFSPWQTIA